MCRGKHSLKWLLIFALVYLSGCKTNKIPTIISQSINDKVPTETKVGSIPQQTQLPESTNETLLTPSSADFQPTLTPTFTPTTFIVSPTATLWPITLNKLAFLNFGSGLYLIDSNGINWKQLTPTHTSLQSTTPFSWSPDGQWIVFVNLNEMDDQKNDIYMIKADRSEVRQITNSPHWKSGPSWSPNGQSIAYADLGSDGESGDIIVIKIDGSYSKKITFTSGQEMFPAWSPDGEKIAFLYREQRLADINLYVMDADGNNRRRITDLPLAFGQVSWSPDGEQIAFGSTNENYCGDIYIANLNGSSSIRLTDIPGCAGSPTWSPDGNLIAFSASEKAEGDIMSMGWQIYIMNKDGSGITRLTSNSAWVSVDPVWSPVPSLIIGEKYTIAEAGANLNLRDSPSLSGISLMKLQEGEFVTILEGPIEADGYFWWKIRVGENVAEGWAVEVAGWYVQLGN